MGFMSNMYMMMPMITQMYMYMIILSALTPVGILVYIHWQYKKQGISDDRQIGVKIILHCFRVLGLTLAVVSAAVIFSLLIINVPDLGQMFRIFGPMVLGGVAVFAGADQVMKKATNNREYLLIQQVFTTLLAFGYMLTAIVMFVVFIVGLFQIGEPQAGKIIGVSATCMIIFGIFGVYFMYLKLKEGSSRSA